MVDYGQEGAEQQHDGAQDVHVDITGEYHFRMLNPQPYPNPEILTIRTVVIPEYANSTMVL